MKKLIAHRGNNNHGYQENTKEALLLALQEDYIAGVELDIRKTKDNQLVIIHNATISWTSNGVGIVKYMTLEELKHYNFGNSQYPSHISTLDEFLNRVDTHKIILIEIKVTDCSDILYETLKKYSNLNIYICSFYERILEEFKAKYPQYPVGIIMGNFINHNVNTSHYDFIVTQNLKQHHNNIFIWGKHSKEVLQALDDSKWIITDQAYQFK